MLNIIMSVPFLTDVPLAVEVTLAGGLAMEVQAPGRRQCPRAGASREAQRRGRGSREQLKSEMGEEPEEWDEGQCLPGQPSLPPRLRPRLLLGAPRKFRFKSGMRPSRPLGGTSVVQKTRPLAAVAHSRRSRLRALQTSAPNADVLGSARAPRRRLPLPGRLRGPAPRASVPSLLPAPTSLNSPKTA